MSVEKKGFKDKTINVQKIILNYLDQHDFDGLCTNGCGCGKDELIPCDHDPSLCIPAYKTKCRGCGGTVYTDGDSAEDCENC